MFLSGVPQGWILGSILLIVFLKDLFIFMSEAKLSNFEVGSTICADSKDIQTMLGIFERSIEMDISWFKKN